MRKSECVCECVCVWWLRQCSSDWRSKGRGQVNEKVPTVKRRAGGGGSPEWTGPNGRGRTNGRSLLSFSLQSDYLLFLGQYSSSLTVRNTETKT